MINSGYNSPSKSKSWKLFGATLREKKTIEKMRYVHKIGKKEHIEILLVVKNIWLSTPPTEFFLTLPKVASNHAYLILII